MPKKETRPSIPSNIRTLEVDPRFVDAKANLDRLRAEQLAIGAAIEEPSAHPNRVHACIEAAERGYG